ncbi:type II toxin-antitoxin system RelE/ParE family toxin [Hyphomicrobium sp. CS1GBMeth3]|uniref:type II toxin-antitoxin system RelE/ParE family toxin n=1 Tax=Hyphomicrobium sp. CS1GBMeth3 TaxID=1892845 RepID=UPI0009311377|nr:type II toxin-antitoxin system RelE/ParE family toxin [Hyphomicrobium sp. CS1GBMeth3]
MIEVRETDEFSSWLSSLTDKPAKARILNRIERLQRGNPGDVEPVGEGVSEMRMHFGPGYRVYFIKRGERFILLLAGGDKSTQERDIIRAKRLAAEYPE